MDVSANGVAQAMQAQQQADLQDKVQLSMLKKSLDQQAQTARQLLDAVPAPQPALANSGALGRTIHVVA